MERQEKAVKYFNQDYNCAQSVALSFLDRLEADKETVVNIASGFGGGMGKLQKTCGALTGAFMVISMYNSENISNKEERKQKTNSLIQQLEQDFTSHYGYSDCSLLTGVDLNTESGQREITVAGIDKKVCERSITACVSWLIKNLLKEN